MMIQKCFGETLYGHVFSEHQPQIFVGWVGFLDVAGVAAFHKVLGMFHSWPSYVFSPVKISFGR